MNFKKFVFILPLITPILNSCKDEPKTTIFRNYNYFCNGNLTSENMYLEGTIDNISRLIDTKIPFVVYLTEDGCGFCESFKPIMKDWTLSTAALVVRINEENAHQINRHFNNLFASYEDNGNKAIQYPTVGIVYSETRCDFVDNGKYMKKSSAFENHMNEKYKAKNIYFTTTENNLNKEYINVCYNYENENSSNIYKQKILSNVMETSSNVVIYNYANFENSLVIEKKRKTTDNQYVSDSHSINSETNNEEIVSLF